MLTLPSSVRVYAARRPVDFRRGFDGLCAEARDTMDLDPFSGHVFVFFNRRRDRVKLLLWDRNGFWLLYKRLERGTFEALRDAVETDAARIEIDARQLRLVLDGVDLKKLRFRKHFAHDVRIDGRRRDGIHGQTKAS
jgi:transposase